MEAQTKLNPVQTFYGTPTPANAIRLALSDSFAYCAPMMPDSDYIKELRKALDRVEAYPKLVNGLRGAIRTYRMEMVNARPGEERQSWEMPLAELCGILRELGEEA